MSTRDKAVEVLHRADGTQNPLRGCLYEHAHYRQVDALEEAGLLMDPELLADAWDEGAGIGAEYGVDAPELNPLQANPYREKR